MALEDAVVEHQIHEAVVVTDQDALLAGLETEAVPKLKQEFLEVVQELVLKVGLAYDLARLEPEKLEDVGVANGQRRLGGLDLSLG